MYTYPCFKQDPKLPNPWVFLPAVILAIILAMAICAWAETIDIQAIIQIESSGNTYAVSQDNCIGLMQISKDVVDDFNKFSGRNRAGFFETPIEHCTDILFNYRANIEIGTWYLTERIPQMLRHYKLENSVENILIAYNFGIGNLVKYRKGRVCLPTETKNYIAKYTKLAKRGL